MIYFFFFSKVPNESFVSTILLDCLRHGTLLKTITDIFYATDGANVRKSEQNIYKSLTDSLPTNNPILSSLVIAYLIFFQLETVGFKLLRGFINSVQLSRMHQV